MINLLKGDCLELLKTLENGSVNALITDPPYNIARDNNFTSMGRAGIDFGDWYKGFNLISWLPIAIEKLKKGSNIIIFTRWKNTTPIIKELEKNNNEAKDIKRIEKKKKKNRKRKKS